MADIEPGYYWAHWDEADSSDFAGWDIVMVSSKDGKVHCMPREDDLPTASDRWTFGPRLRSPERKPGWPEEEYDCKDAPTR